eukprot:11833311-Alexandrium_andersonii.AAC.1
MPQGDASVVMTHSTGKWRECTWRARASGPCTSPKNASNHRRTGAIRSTCAMDAGRRAASGAAANTARA